MPGRRFATACLRAGLYALVIAVGFAGGTAYRLTKGEIALPDWAVTRAQDRLNRALAPAILTVDGVALAYDRGEGALRLRLQDAALEQDGARLAAIPSVRLALDGPALASGRLRPRVLTVDGLSLDVARDAEGRLSLALPSGGGGALPATFPEALAALDAVLDQPAVAALTRIDVTGVTLRGRDAITGLDETLRDGTLRLTRDDGGVAADLSVALSTDGGAARLSVRLERGPEGAEARVALTDLPLARLAEMAPQVPALTLVRATIEATGTLALDESGQPGPLLGRVSLRDGVLVARPRLALDRAALAFAWPPGATRIELSEIAASSDELSLAAEGQLLLPDGVTGPAIAQLRLGRTIFDPEDMFERRVEFDDGTIEARLTQSPLALSVGQAMVTGASGTARLSGDVTFVPEGIAGAMRATIPRMRIGEVSALWPPELAPQARRWFVNNLLDGTATDATALLRLTPGAAPDARASLSFEDATFRYLRNLPPAESASGAVQLDGTRLTARVDRGTVPALGPGDDRGPGTGIVAVGGSDIVIRDLAVQPPRAEAALTVAGDIGDVLALLDNPPFRLLERTRRTRDLASGRGSARVTVALPLRPGNAPSDIDWAVEADLRDVTSTRIIPDRELSAELLSLTADPVAVRIAGDMVVAGMPFAGSWRQALPPRSDTPIVPGAPPGPPVPLPEPGRVAGTARVTPEGLARLGVSVAALDLSGAADARVDIVLEQGERPVLSASSDLRGMAVGLDAVDWSKPSGTAGAFEVEVVLGGTPEVRRVTLDTPGLTASGRIGLRDGGGLDMARFDAVRLPWFRGAVTLTGRGNAPPAIAVTGGRADLRGAPFGGGAGGSGSGGAASPLDITLDSLTVTEGIALTGLRARLQGPQGSFTGRINGGQPVEGVLAPQTGGTAVQIRGADAGGVLRSAGLFQDARGGTIALTLRSTGRAGTYDGALRIADVRVRNAPALASLLQTLSVVGILEQLDGEGLAFQTVESDFTLNPDDIAVRRASAVGPSMSITADGRYDLGTKQMDLQGVISPIYLVNGLFGALFSRRDEGLFGFTYRLRGAVADPVVSVDPLSILTPGRFRDIFRRAPPS